MNTTGDPSWTPTRAEALDRLADFLPRAGGAYADQRNYDLGPEDRSNISTLSPYLRHRLITEAEVVAAAVGRHGPHRADRFVGEACWRTYWKGWLELHPGTWSDYRALVRADLDRLDRDSGLRGRYDAAVGGGSGIACVDAWARELIEVGYLHNHARMWFASLWIFTLGLPWSLGADFFLRHLMDGDPASNTLSWRWVAGLQTKGKTYLATRENIAKFTNGRFRPREPLADRAEAIDRPGEPAIQPLARSGRVDPDRPFGLLLVDDDLTAESLPLGPTRPVAAAGLLATADRSPLPVGSVVAEFAAGALADGLQRAGRHFGIPTSQLDGDWPGAVGAWANAYQVDQIAVADVPIGPARERVDALEPALARQGLRLVRVRRDWDDTLWPMATAGYFAFKKKLPRALNNLGIGDRAR